MRKKTILLLGKFSHEKLNFNRNCQKDILQRQNCGIVFSCHFSYGYYTPPNSLPSYQ